VTAIISHYLDSIRDSLRLDVSSKKEVITELETHIADKFQELREAGLSEEDAADTCISLLGSAKLVARQIYEAHSQGTWQQALFASLPHLLFGLLFVLNWWQGIGGLLILLILILSTTVYGWWRGNPTWLFPWLGYALLPVIAAGLPLLYLPKGWSWLAILIYIPLGLWLLYSIVGRTIKKDWLYLSLMLLPMPIIIGWFIAVEWRGFPEYSLERLRYFAPWIGLSFLALAASVVTFIRLRKRWLKIAVLFITGLTTLTLVAFYGWGRLELIAFLVLILLMVSIFLIPALLENGVRSGKWDRIFEHRPMA